MEGTTTDKDGISNTEKWQNTIKSAVQEKYKQIRDFIQKQNTRMKGMIVISVGRDYFVSKYTRRDMYLPTTLIDALQDVLIALKQTGKYEYLQELVLIAGKNANQVYVARTQPD